MDPRQASSHDAYYSASEALSSGFLTPPSPFDGRRDSIASSQSSYSQSFASGYSTNTDYVMPETPLCGRSPLEQDDFIDVASYGLSHDLSEQQLHGLPLVSQQKELAPEDGLYESFVMVPPATTLATSHLHAHVGLAASGNFHGPLHPHAIGMANVSSAEPAWDNASTIIWPDSARHSYSYVDRHVPRFPHLDPSAMEAVQATWEPSMTSPLENLHQVPSETIMPADSMLEDYVHIHPDGFEITNIVNESQQSFPHTPQQVLFKREDSTMIKEEHEDVDDRRPSRKRMYVKQTGAKGLKRERRTGGATKKKPKSSKKQYAPAQYIGDIEFTSEIVQTHVAPADRKPCAFLGCTRSFNRIEHLRRHERTHTGEIGATCRVCMKAFGRNDNCIAHYQTHIKKPGKKEGRNTKMSLREVEEKVGDYKTIEKLRIKLAKDLEADSRK